MIENYKSYYSDDLYEYCTILAGDVESTITEKIVLPNPLSENLIIIFRTTINTEASIYFALLNRDSIIYTLNTIFEGDIILNIDSQYKNKLNITSVVSTSLIQIRCIIFHNGIKYKKLQELSPYFEY